jgi:hypothetical protein
MGRLFEKLGVDSRHGLAVYGLTSFSMDLAAIREKLDHRSPFAIPAAIRNQLIYDSKIQSENGIAQGVRRELEKRSG